MLPRRWFVIVQVVAKLLVYETSACVDGVVVV